MRLLLALISTVLLTACQTGAGGNPPARSSEITANKVSDPNEIVSLSGNGPVRAGEREFVTGTKISLKWSHSERQVETGINWQDSLKMLGIFYLKNLESGVTDCMGLIDRGTTYRPGSWHVTCSNPLGYMYGDISFVGDRANGHGIDSDGERIILTIR